MLQVLMALLGLGGKLWEKRQDLKSRELEAETVIKIRRMEDAKNWETVVAQRSGRLLRWILAIHVLVGLDVTMYLTLTGAENPGVLFAVFDKIPPWYIGLLTSMFAWSFASEPMKTAGGKLVQAWADRKASKQEKVLGNVYAKGTPRSSSTGARTKPQIHSDPFSGMPSGD